MVLVIDPFGYIYDVRYGGGLLLNTGFFIMVGDEIHIVANGSSSAPEEEPVNPPSECISVFL